MADSKVFVGSDYHQGSVQVGVEDQAGTMLLNRKCPDDWRTMVKAVERCGRVVGVGIESCTVPGCYAISENALVLGYISNDGYNFFGRVRASPLVTRHDCHLPCSSFILQPSSFGRVARVRRRRICP